LRGGWRLLDLVRKSLVKYKIRRFSRGPNTQTWSRFGPSEYVKHFTTLQSYVMQLTTVG
jgi:hypothetical protein